VGHRNPDNDSIMSAIAYAWLKNATSADSSVYEAVRLGPLPHETRWVLERYGIEKPRVIAHVYRRVCDAMTKEVVSVREDATLLEAGRIMRDRNLRALVVTDAAGCYCGLISTRMLAELFISELDTDRPRHETLAQAVGGFLDKGALVLEPEALLKDVTESVLAASLREAIVLDEDGVCVGVLTRTDIARPPRRKVILVDHNESAQAVPGIDDAAVVEILDHHRIGDVQTTLPIRFLNMPVGATATIVALEYQSHPHAGLPAPMAACLLAAIMTDTVLLKSPTATDTDRAVAQWLGDALGVDALAFGIELFGSRDAASPPTVEAITGADAKEFELGEHRVLIAQYETVSLARVLEHEATLTAHMEKVRVERGYEFVLLMVTDVVAEGSQVIVAGRPSIVERALGISLHSGSVWMPGILSRKKQVLPRVLEQV
jgi:manganese-dependent inorganic pyrophosphatase